MPASESGPTAGAPAAQIVRRDLVDQAGPGPAPVQGLQGGPDRAVAEPEAAALVAQQPAVAVDRGRAAAAGEPGGDGAGADEHQPVHGGAGRGRQRDLGVAADAHGRSGDPVGGQGVAHAGQRQAVAALVAQAGRGTGEAAVRRRHPPPYALRHRPQRLSHRVGQMRGQVGAAHAQRVAGPTGAAAEHGGRLTVAVAVTAAGRHQQGPGTCAARVDTDHPRLAVDFIHRHAWWLMDSPAHKP